MKALMIGGNDEDFVLVSNLFKSYFNKVEIVRAKTQEESIGLISYDGPFGFFLMDIEDKGNLVDPNAAIPMLFDLAGARPVIFLASDAGLKGAVSQEVFNLHTQNRHIKKPMVIDDFRAAISEALEWCKLQEFDEGVIEVSKSEYIPMKIKNFYFAKESQFDVYMEYTETQFVKIVSKNKPYTFSFLDSYAKKGVRYLYLFKDDHLKFLEQEIARCQKALQNANPSSNEVYLIQINAIELLHSYIKTIGATDTIYAFLDQIINSVHDVLTCNFEVTSILDKFPNRFPGVASQSLMVSYLNLAMVLKLGWNSEPTRKKLVFASIMMDIYCTDQNYKQLHLGEDEEAEAALPDDKKQEIEEYKNHTIKAAELSRRFVQYPEVDFLIELHHEHPAGKGFPHGYSSLKLTTICCVFILTHTLANRLEGKPINTDTIQAAYDDFSDSYGSGNFRDAIKALKRILNVH